ncbi:hypothetical protein P5W99_30025 [Paraburkholderia sp. A3BS-1L]|uniref:hypothetical protein n=1 Tax=Paraburkholderia sp. A3BS-1L TaxID=3028375 RepID=UPI003DA81391
MSTPVSRRDFAHLLRVHAPEPPASPVPRRDIRSPVLSHEQAAATARAIVRANNRRLGLTPDAGMPPEQANMTATAKRIVEVARRVGLAW